jgi:hypothetical protein
MIRFLALEHTTDLNAWKLRDQITVECLTHVEYEYCSTSTGRFYRIFIHFYLLIFNAASDYLRRERIVLAHLNSCGLVALLMSSWSGLSCSCWLWFATQQIRGKSRANYNQQEHTPQATTGVHEVVQSIRTILDELQDNTLSTQIRGRVEDKQGNVEIASKTACKSGATSHV